MRRVVCTHARVCVGGGGQGQRRGAPRRQGQDGAGALATSAARHREGAGLVCELLPRLRVAASLHFSSCAAVPRGRACARACMPPPETRQSSSSCSRPAPSPRAPLAAPQYRSRRNYTNPAWLGPRIADKLLISLIMLTLYLGIGERAGFRIRIQTDDATKRVALQQRCRQAAACLAIMLTLHVTGDKWEGVGGAGGLSGLSGRARTRGAASHGAPAWLSGSGLARRIGGCAWRTRIPPPPLRMAPKRPTAPPPNRRQRLWARQPHQHPVRALHVGAAARLWGRKLRARHRAG